MFKKILFLFSTIFFLNNIGVFAAPAIVSVNDTSSAFDFASNLPKYEKFELTFTIDSSYANPYDYDTSTGGVKIDAYFTNPDGITIDTVAAFWFQDYVRSRGINDTEVLNTTGVPPSWKIRYTPDTTGIFSYDVILNDSTGLYTIIDDSTFTAVSSSNTGFIKINPNNSQYFAYGDGSEYFGIGSNVAWWGSLWPSSKKTYYYDDYFDTMQANGLNFARVWTVNSVWLFTDWTATIQQDSTDLGGSYDLADAWRLDTIFESAKDRGIYIQFCLEDAVQFGNNHWPENLYNTANGGPCATISLFFTNADAKKYVKRLYRYIIARYGHNTSIMAWELWNEVDGLEWSIPSQEWSTTWVAIENWHTEMAQEVSDADIYDHLITTSMAGFKTRTVLFGQSNIDYGQIHVYYVPDWPYHYDPKEFSELTSYYSQELHEGVPDKPNVIGEMGILDSSSQFPGEAYDTLAPNDTSGVFLHNMLWSGTLNGLATTPLLWAWEENFQTYPLWWQNYKILSNYLSGETISDTTLVIIDSKKENLLSSSNTGFEDDFTGWTQNPPRDNWSIDTTIYHSGTKSLRWEHNTSEALEIMAIANLTANKEYTLTAWIKMNGVVGSFPEFGLTMGTQVNDGVDFNYYTRTPVIKGTSDWQQYSFTFTSPPYKNSYMSYVKFPFSYSFGTAWVDDVVIAPSGINAPPISSNNNIRMMAQKNDSTVLGWIQNVNHNWKNVIHDSTINSETATVTIPNMSNATYLIEWWDTYSTTGTLYRKQRATISDSNLVLYLTSPLATDIAAKIKPLADVTSYSTLNWGYAGSGVDPESGYSSTDFTFRVKYTDSANYFPNYINLILDKDGDPVTADEVFSMDELDTTDNDITNGKIYTKTVNIPYTVYYDNISYRFEAFDGISFVPGSPVSVTNKPDLILDLSLEIVDTTEIDLGQINLSSFSEPAGIILQNTGRPASLSLQITDTSGIGNYELKALFTGVSGETPVVVDFKDDDIFGTTKIKATEDVFGDSTFLTNGENLSVGDSVKVWFLFKSPDSSNSQNEENITININAEDP